MAKPLVFVTRSIDPTALEKLRQAAEVILWGEINPPPVDTLRSQAAKADALLTMLTDPIDAGLIQSADQLQVISQMAVGYDNIDIQAATKKGIPVGHTPGVLTETTADFTWALLMALARRVVESSNQVQQGIWQPWGPDVLTGEDIHGATLGIVGFGRIGQAVARRASGFGMRVIYHDFEAHPEVDQRLGTRLVSLDELLAQADFVSLHVYLSAETRKMIARPELERMKPSAYLINTARGGVIDLDDLAWAIDSKRIAGAALDVFDPEPVPANHPLLHRDNVIITPHIASASKKTRAQMAAMAVENILAALSGRPIPYCANPDVYAKRGNLG